jgi:hypothetical protein
VHLVRSNSASSAAAGTTPERHKTGRRGRRDEEDEACGGLHSAAAKGGDVEGRAAARDRVRPRGTEMGVDRELFIAVSWMRERWIVWMEER